MALTLDILKALSMMMVWFAVGVWAFQAGVRTSGDSRITEVRNASPPASENYRELLPIEQEGHDQYIR